MQNAKQKQNQNPNKNKRVFDVVCFNLFSYLILFITFQTNEHISTAPGIELSPPFTISAREGELEILFPNRLC